MNIISPSAAMRSQATETSSLETECLFGETVTILEKKADWYYCKLLTDNYCGWIKAIHLGKTPRSTHRVVSLRTFLYKDRDIKSGCINYLPLGAQICIDDIDEIWSKVLLNSFSNHKYAYIPNNNIIKIGKKINDWVGVAEKFLGTPYVWGGRNSIGIDCSALLQLSYQTYGEDIPRNSTDQSLLKKIILNKDDHLERGCVVFWEGHIAIMLDDLNSIHANAFHMEVSKEPLTTIIGRTKKNSPIIKIMNFN